MFDEDYNLLKAKVLGGFKRNSRRASVLSEKTKLVQTACEKKTQKHKREIQESEDSDITLEGEEEDEVTLPLA